MTSDKNRHGIALRPAACARPAPGTCRHEHHPACWRWRNKRESVCVRAVSTLGCQQTHCHLQLVAFGSPSALPPCFAIGMARGPGPSGRATLWREGLAEKRREKSPGKVHVTGHLLDGANHERLGKYGLGQLVGPPNGDATPRLAGASCTVRWPRGNLRNLGRRIRVSF